MKMWEIKLLLIKENHKNTAFLSKLDWGQYIAQINLPALITDTLEQKHHLTKDFMCVFYNQRMACNPDLTFLGVTDNLFLQFKIKC